MKKSVIVLSILALFLVGCATSFTGSSKISGGPEQCVEICSKWKMELVGMVALGEYTDGCICKVKEAKISTSDIGKAVILSSASGGAGIVGVWQKAND
jgi:hypothetical protein